MKKNLFLESYLKVNSVSLILVLCVLNLLVMHYNILFLCGIETELDFTLFMDHLLGVCFDVGIMYLAFFFLSLKRQIASISACFAITWLWAFSNIIYSRFFFHYLTLSAINQGRVLADDLIIKCIVDSFQLIDFY